MVSEDLRHEALIKSPRGDDVSQWDGTTVIVTESSINTYTVTTDKVAYIRGVNFEDRAGLTSVDLYLDGSTTATEHWDKHMTPHPLADMADLDTFKPPHRAVTTVSLQATGSTTIGRVRSVLVMYETDA